MPLNISLFTRHTRPSPHCIANVGNGVTCGRDSAPGESLCTFHRTLFGPWLKAATKRAA